MIWRPRSGGCGIAVHTVSPRDHYVSPPIHTRGDYPSPPLRMRAIRTKRERVGTCPRGCFPSDLCLAPRSNLGPIWRIHTGQPVVLFNGLFWRSIKNHDWGYPMSRHYVIPSGSVHMIMAIGPGSPSPVRRHWTYTPLGMLQEFPQVQQASTTHRGPTPRTRDDPASPSWLIPCEDPSSQ